MLLRVEFEKLWEEEIVSRWPVWEQNLTSVTRDDWFETLMPYPYHITAQAIQNFRIDNDKVDSKSQGLPKMATIRDYCRKLLPQKGNPEKDFVPYTPIAAATMNSILEKQAASGNKFAAQFLAKKNAPTKGCVIIADTDKPIVYCPNCDIVIRQDSLFRKCDKCGMRGCYDCMSKDISQTDDPNFIDFCPNCTTPVPVESSVANPSTAAGTGFFSEAELVQFAKDDNL